MVIVFVYAAIMLYMVAPAAAFVLCLIVFGSLLFLKKNTFLERLMAVLVLSMPLYSISVFGLSVHHLFSWSTLFLVVFIVFSAAHLPAVSRGTIVASIVLVGTSVVTSALVSAPESAVFYYLVQQLLFIAPIMIAYLARKRLSSKLTPVGAEQLLVVATQTITGTALAVISQYVLYTFLGISAGSVSFFGGGRVVFDLTFNAFSILSLFLGVGVVLNLLLFQKRPRIAYMLGMVACFVGIIANTSRTGLVAAIVVSLWLITFPARQSGRKRRPFLFLWLSGIAVIGVYIVDQFGVRGKLTGLLDDNGRVETYANALAIWVSSWKNFFFGISYGGDGYPYMVPHNVVVEMLLRSGAVAAVVVLLLAYFLLRFFRGSEAQFPVAVLVIGAMIVSGIYAVKFMPVLVVLLILTTTKQSKDPNPLLHTVESPGRWLAGSFDFASVRARIRAARRDEETST